MVQYEKVMSKYLKKENNSLKLEYKDIQQLKLVWYETIFDY